MEITTKTATEIRTASAMSGGTITQESGEQGDYIPIVDHLMQEKFQLKNQHRENLTSTVSRSSALRPFSMFQNSKENNKKFIGIGSSWNITADQMDVVFVEYDNSTDINIVEE